MKYVVTRELVEQYIKNSLNKIRDTEEQISLLENNFDMINHTMSLKIQLIESKKELLDSITKLQKREEQE